MNFRKGDRAAVAFDVSVTVLVGIQCSFGQAQYDINYFIFARLSYI
jgi:hypothetical protein